MPDDLDLDDPNDQLGSRSDALRLEVLTTPFLISKVTSSTSFEDPSTATDEEIRRWNTITLEGYWGQQQAYQNGYHKKFQEVHQLYTSENHSEDGGVPLPQQASM